MLTSAAPVRIRIRRWTPRQLLERNHLNLVSLRENIDTGAATGRCFPSMMGALHQRERKLRAGRASADRDSAKTRGKSGGRPRTDVVKLRDAKAHYDNCGKAADESSLLPRSTAGSAIDTAN